VSSLPFRPAVSAAGWIAVSGQIGVDADEEFGGDVTSQTRRALQNLEDRLRSHGVELAHVVKVNVFLTSMGDYELMNAAYAKFFPDAPPARTCVGVVGLPRGARVEIEAWAFRG
jgi:2-iminobutanoate/2-iminopropanoate deaminase